MRVVFSVLTKRICMHKTNFLRIYSNIVLKVILNQWRSEGIWRPGANLNFAPPPPPLKKIPKKMII